LAVDDMQYLIPLVSALIGAIIGSTLTYRVNKHLDDQKRRFQVYTQLSGKSRTLKQIYNSLMHEKILSDYFFIINEKDNNPNFDYKYRRHLDLSDKYKHQFFYYYNDIMELLSSIDILYKDSLVVNALIKKVINSKNFNDIDAQRDTFAKAFREELLDRIEKQKTGKKNPSGSIEDLMEVAYLASTHFLDKEVAWPLDNLLDYLKNNLKN